MPKILEQAFVHSSFPAEPPLLRLDESPCLYFPAPILGQVPSQREDIRNLLAIRDTGTCPCEPAGDLLTRRLTELDAEINRLEALRTEMTTMLDALPAGECSQTTPGTWLQREGGDPR